MSDYLELYRPLTNEEFGQLPKLRYLRVNGRKLTGDFKHVLSELRWFDWSIGSFELTNFHIKNLVVLRLSWCWIENDTWSEIKMPQKLKVLCLTAVRGIRRLPDLSTCATLEVLKLEFWSQSIQIEPSIGYLINLRKLIILSRSGMEELPGSIGNLKKLEKLHLWDSYFFKVEIPWSIGRLSSLRILILEHIGFSSPRTSGCDEFDSLPERPHSLTDLAVLPKSITTLPTSLSNLWIQWNYPIEIPRDIGKLSKLETLIFSDCMIINSLPAEIGALSQLKILKVKICTSLRFILGLPSSLFELHIKECDSLERLPDLSNLKNLSTLKLRGCPELKGIQGLEQLESLRYLEVSSCQSVERLLDLSNLKSLKELAIRGWDNLTEIRGLEELESLEVLVIGSCKLLKLPDLSNLKNLKSSSISLFKFLYECESDTEPDSESDGDPRA